MRHWGIRTNRLLKNNFTRLGNSSTVTSILYFLLYENSNCLIILTCLKSVSRRTERQRCLSSSQFLHYPTYENLTKTAFCNSFEAVTQSLPIGTFAIMIWRHWFAPKAFLNGCVNRLQLNEPRREYRTRLTLWHKARILTSYSIRYVFPFLRNFKFLLDDVWLNCVYNRLWRLIRPCMLFFVSLTIR